MIEGMIKALIIFLIVSSVRYIYRRFFVKMISEDMWISLIDVYNDGDSTQEERKKAEQILIYYEPLLLARGIRYMTNEEFLARKNQQRIPARKTTSGRQVTSPSAMKIERPIRTGNAHLPPLLPKQSCSMIGLITIAQHDQTFGPYDVAGVVALWDQGQLAGNALYWHDQLDDWKSLASDIEALRMMQA